MHPLLKLDGGIHFGYLLCCWAIGTGLSEGLLSGFVLFFFFARMEKMLQTTPESVAAALSVCCSLSTRKR